MPEERRQLSPYTPNRPEWNQLPWDEAKKRASELYHTHEVSFVGHTDDHFFFQVFGKGEIPIPKPPLSEEVTSEALYDLVQDEVSKMASAINNDGIQAQLEYLRSRGWSDNDIRQAVEKEAQS